MAAFGRCVLRFMRMERERDRKPAKVRAKAVYRAGRLEFAESVTPPVDGSDVLVEYEAAAQKSLAIHFGVLAADSADEMARAVEQDCERVDAGEW